MIKGFSIHELVPEDIFNLRGEKAWQLFDTNALLTLEWVRDHLGSATVNNWKWGGDFSQSGFRTFDFYLERSQSRYPTLSAELQKSKAIEMYHGSLSQHKFGRAFDVKLSNVTAEEAREYIKSHWQNSGLNWAVSLEEKVSWLHIDTRPRPDNKVYSFNPY